ncbi:MAG: PAS domain-containing protein [Proteobacteria bacterium]|nr:PAS domain-containing protein [Pseudomonadota bacterium]
MNDLDDTTSKGSQRTALSTEEQLALAIEALTEHVVLFDAEDRIVLANRAWRELNKEVAESTKPGARFEDHLRALIEKGLLPEAAGREEAWLCERMERHLNPSGPFEVARQDGRWIRLYEQRLPNDGIILIISDITESKRVDQALIESEARFRAVVDNSPTKIHIKDAEGRYILVNPLAEKLFGFTDEEARGKTSYDIFPKEVADAFTAHDRQVVESGETAEQVEHFTLEDGEHTYLTVKFPIPDGQGGVAGIAAIGTDITQQERAKTEMLWAKEQAELANRAKSEFLANMSHELRTPLNAILGFSELMGNATLGPLGNPKYQEYAKDINDSGRHLLALIDDILDLSKIEAGQLELDEEDIDVAMTIRSCMVLVKERARNGGVRLKTDIPDGLPALHADKRKLKQILVNLLSNAVKFTPDGGEVTLKAWSRPDSGYVFQVIDSGIGIALADIPTALSAFGQVDSALSRKFAGTGLGLPLTKSLVEMHGGSLDLQSEEGAGTTVTVRFPSERIVHLPEAAETGSPAV